MYFQKIRAFSDFALEIPYNPAQIQKDLSHLLTSLTDAEQKSLDIQIQKFTEDLEKYTSQTIS